MEKPMYFIPTRDDVANLRVGDDVLGVFGWGKVTTIFAQGDNIHGKAYVCFYYQWNGKGSVCSGSWVEGKLVRTMDVSHRHTSAQTDKIEAKMLAHNLRSCQVGDWWYV